MKELNELVELAEKADREVTWSLLPFDLAKEDWCVEVVDYIALMSPHTILAIAKAFRALEQQKVAAEHERDCHMDIAEHFKARCKEMEDQKPYGFVHNIVDPPGCGVAASIFKEENRHYGRPVFTHPAPAVNLAELVEDETTLTAGFNALVDCLEDCGDAEQGLRLALRAIMRNIEEANKK